MATIFRLLIPKELKSAHNRRLLIALIFVIVSVLRWDRDLDILTSAYHSTHSKPSPSSPAQPLATVGYAISITKCAPKPRFFDAAAVLRRSIQLNSWPLHATSRYGAKFYAFTTKPTDGSDPANDKCFQILSLAGWEVLPQPPPLYPSLIKEPEGSVLRTGIVKDGCCGPDELIKLATYQLTEHDMAVHLDFDTLVIHPLDELFDVMHFSPTTEEGRKARVQLAEIAAPTYVNRRLTGDPSTSGNSHMNATELLANITVDAYFTKDYNMIIPGPASQRVGVQGGFLVVRPSESTYAHLISLVYSGEFYAGFNARNTGWFKSGYGRHIFGSMTIQGLMAYYFDMRQLEHSVELNRCRYNNIADNARVSSRAKNAKYPRGTLLPFVRDESDPQYNFIDTKCRDGREKCDETDCQRFPLKKARVLHYTYCKHPWKCTACEYLETYIEPTCYEMKREWFRVRRTLPGEGDRTLELVKGDDFGPLAVIREDGEAELTEGNCYKEYFLGYCLEKGNYVSMPWRNLSAI